MNDLLSASMTWMDQLWDDEAALLWTVRREWHQTRDTAWYALGLLQRDADGDDDRAARAIEAVLDTQYHAPGSDFDGTFKRAPEEPDPPDDAIMWIHYDPNWRQFIGTTFAVICDRYADRFSASLVSRMRSAIDHAVNGEGDDRVSPHYANIALMKAWLDQWAGRDAIGFASTVTSAFEEHGAFLEYNSPTYYGIDLFALALWRSSDALAEMGKRIEHALWRDIARFYHAGLRNMSGPHDRSYGMDMTSHATPLGLWLWSILGRDAAPFPDTSGKFNHPHDFCFAPCVVGFDASVPDDALPHLSSFIGERTIVQTVTREPKRVATAWLADDVMLGGWTGPTSGIGLFQHHHATAHWRRPSERSVGWLRLRPDVVADARASTGTLEIDTTTIKPIVFEVQPAPVLTDRGFATDGIDISVETNASRAVIADNGDLVFAPAEGPSRLVLRVLG